MRVVSALSCFTAAGPLLHTPLPFGTTSSALSHNNNGAQQQLTTIMRKRRASMVFEYDTPSRPNSSSSVSVQVRPHSSSDCTSTCRTSGPALMTRGGVTAATPKAQSAYNRLKAFLNKRFFLLGAAAMVASARFAPALGTSGGLLSLSVSKAGEREGRYCDYYYCVVMRKRLACFCVAWHRRRVPDWVVRVVAIGMTADSEREITQQQALQESKRMIVRIRQYDGYAFTRNKSVEQDSTAGGVKQSAARVKTATECLWHD